jgi:asparagine synthase (glutamine-hydrolysing)
VRLYIAGGLPVRRVAAGHGCVLGHLFDNSGADAPETLAAGMFGFADEPIVERCWGSYVAFAAEPDRIRILRDPSGGLAAYHAWEGQALYVTSAPHLLVEAGLVPAELDWEVIALSLARHSAREPRTAIRAIGELLPGRAMVAHGSSYATRPVWDPWRCAARDCRTGAAEALENVLTSTLAAWARGTRRPLIEVSGGLDSAIVAAGVSAAASGASLISFAAAPGDPDESLYARALADHLGLALEIVRPDVADVDLTRSMSRDLPRPNARAFVQAADLCSLRHAEAIGADAFFSGGGGDDLFCYLRTILPAIDRLRAEGFRAMLGTCADVGLMNHATIWDALGKAARHLMRGARRPKVDSLFLAPSAPDTCRGAGMKGAPPRQPGKAAHVEALLSIHNYLEGHARAAFAPIHSPLLSQPLVECCLSIPSWLWCDGGRNRAVARAAFAARLPPLLLERRSKGSFDGFCAGLLHARRKLVADMLGDGLLARHGLVDAEKVRLALEDPFPPAETVGRILALVDAESWAGAWNQRLAARG